MTTENKNISTTLDGIQSKTQIQNLLDRLNDPTLTQGQYSQIRYEYTKLNEGYKDAVYVDTAGKKTIGIGFNMESSSARDDWNHVFQGSISFDSAHNGLIKLNDLQIKQLYDYSVVTRESQLFGNAGIYKDVTNQLTANQKLAIEDLYYNGGYYDEKNL